MELEDTLVCPNEEGKIFIPLRNATVDTLQVLPSELIGSVDLIEVEEDPGIGGTPH